jgi:hypothetical protein
MSYAISKKSVFLENSESPSEISRLIFDLISSPHVWTDKKNPPTFLQGDSKLTKLSSHPSYQ